jgi:two-component system NtrC family sensor kinase
MAEGVVVRKRRTVAARVLLSYALITLAFALVAGWSVVAQRKAAREADLVRSGYLPLSLALRDLVAGQDTWNTQLNHITTARNPADKRWWFETTLRMGRPKMYGHVRAAIARAFAGSREESIAAVGRQLSGETAEIETFLRGDTPLLTELFVALEHGDTKRAEKLRDELVTRGSQAKQRLSRLEQRVQRNIDSLFATARSRELVMLQLLVGLSVLTVLVGVVMAFYARRVLRPLAAVTERAKAVAHGDLTPREVVPSNDEIGELAATFESMVSAIARANEQLLAAERLATIGKMAAKVTHEIRNPLSSMALSVELLEEELGGDASEAGSLLSAIKNEVERLTALSNQYLSMARRQTVTLEPADLGQLVRQACEFMRGDLERHGVALRVEVEARLPSVRADESQIKQALYNLIRNAREAMPQGGTLAVGVRHVDAQRVDITVDDEGVGMDEQTRTRLFEPFFTTKDRGTGLGLAITRQIVQGHHGQIVCERRDAGGTRFRIQLPVLAEDQDDPYPEPLPVAAREQQ